MPSAQLTWINRVTVANRSCTIVPTPIEMFSYRRHKLRLPPPHRYRIALRYRCWCSRRGRPGCRHHMPLRLMDNAITAHRILALVRTGVAVDAVAIVARFVWVDDAVAAANRPNPHGVTADAL